jgi:hypothetical protein
MRPPALAASREFQLNRNAAVLLAVDRISTASRRQ